MNVLSLFSGIGGLDLGLQRAGMTIVGQVEIDPWCRKILAKHWPEVPRHDDVRTAADWWGGRDAPDLVCGGFPCQPVSLAGKGLAQADSRWLWPAFADVIRHLRPAYVLVENVPGLLGRGMGDILGDLAALGYDAEWDCIPAAFVGAPHIRNRVWIVAYPASQGLQGRRPKRGLGKSCRPLETGRGGDALADPALADERAPNGDDTGCSGQRLALQVTAGRSSRTPDIPELRSWPSPAIGSWWITEPSVGRVAAGVPARVDRLRGLGNAVVPQVAEHIGRLILAGAA